VVWLSLGASCRLPGGGSDCADRQRRV